MARKFKTFATLLALVCFILTFSVIAEPASAATTYTVVPGDSMWKIAVKYEVGLSELVGANPSIKNPSLIYPGQVLVIPVQDALKAFENQVIQLTNAERQKAGLQPLKTNWQLSRVARYKSEDMRDHNYFSHNSPNYGSPFDMMKQFGITYRAAGENIAAGQRTPAEVVRAWMNSSGHRANILNPNYNEIGVGYASGGSYGNYWTQHFIKSN